MQLIGVTDARTFCIFYVFRECFHISYLLRFKHCIKESLCNCIGTIIQLTL